MIIGLEKKVKGVDLIDAIKESLSSLGDCKVVTSELPRFEPGSVKKVVDKFGATIYQMNSCVVGFWFVKREIKNESGFHFVVEEIKADKEYEEIDISVYWEQHIIGYTKRNIERSPQFEIIEPLLRMFVEALYKHKHITAVQAA